MTRTGGGPMTPLEDRVRDAIRAKAAEVPPDAVPPLRLPARRRSSFSLAHGGREREGGLAGRARAGRAWVTPLAAAAAVAAVLAVVFALGGVIPSGRPAKGQLAGLAALPRYYVALTFTGPGGCCDAGLVTPQTRAIVRATATGRALATVMPPRPYGTFVGVSAAADDRTFVLAAQKLSPYFPVNEAKPPVPATKFFLLRLHPGRSRPDARATLTPLNMPVIPGGTAVSDVALSPDGSRLAVVAGRADVRRPYLQNLRVYNLAGGTERTYHPAGAGSPYSGDTGAVPITANTLSWGADNRTLAFVWRAWTGGGEVRLLDTARPGSGLLANSRVAIPWSRTTSWTQIQLTADGQAIFANVNNPYKGGNIEHLAEFSAQTGKLVRVFNVIRDMAVDVEQVHWMSPSGRVLLVTDALRGRHHSNAHFADVDAGMLADGHYTPLPWSENTFTAAW
jgi:hypothetical protein